GTHALSPNRMRGFTFEASMFGFQVGIAAILFCRFFTVSKAVMFALVSALIIFTTSKGGLITFSLAFAISLLISDVIGGKVKMLLVCIMLFILPIVFMTFLFPVFQSDVESYNSSATRSVMIFISVYTLLTEPWGVGYFGYLTAIYEKGPAVVSFVDSFFPNLLKFDEVLPYFIQGTVKGVGTKSFVFDWIIYFGGIFVWFLWR
ncbi:MAG: hypothetical protein RPR97_08640, partial [Colwellia sp.]